MLGRVIFFHKTYGFLRLLEGELPEGVEKEDVENDIFFYYKDIILEDDEVYREVFRGDLVSFELARDKRRIRAVNVKKEKELIDGKEILRAYVFEFENNEFELDKFYMGAISKIPAGLKYTYVFKDKMVITNVKIDRKEAEKLSQGEQIEEYFVKFL